MEKWLKIPSKKIFDYEGSLCLLGETNYKMGEFALKNLILDILQQNNTLGVFSYISIGLALVVFIIGLFCILKKKKYGVYVLASSLLLLVNPAIDFLFN